MGKSVSEGLQPDDLFSDIADSVKVSPTSSLEKSSTPSTTEQYQFDPSNKYYEYIDNPTPFSSNVDKISANKQSNWTKLGRGLEVAGANLASSFGQSLASTFDLVNGYHTAKGLFDDTSNDDFNSSLFGIVNTKQMADWSKGVQERNQIFEKNPGTTSPGDVGWWTNEILPQMGTLVGTAGSALATTVGIEATTGGTGTAVAAANLYNKVKSAWGLVKAGEIVEGGLDLAKGMKGAAAMYATIARYSEARFEAQNNYQNTYDKLSNTLKPDGTPYTEDEKKHFASQGAKVDFGLTLAQLPLDILAMRAMIFNPLTGGATGGVIEGGLEKVAGMFGESKVGQLAGKGATKLLGAGVEGIISGGIPIFQEEGEHHAMVLAGLDDNKSSWNERVGKEVGNSDFSTMVVSGVLGGLLIGPAMNATKNIINSNKIQQFNDRYKNYVSNVVPTLNTLSNSITKADASGDAKTASMGRRRFNADRVLDALHLDTQAGKSDMYNTHLNFLQSTLDQVNNNQQINIEDLFGKVSPEQVAQVKKEFQSYIDDAKSMKDIYNTVGQRYNRNLVPVIANQHFSLNELLNEKANVDTNLATQQSGLSQYGLLSPQGKELHEAEYTLNALNLEKNRLTTQLTTISNEHERENIKNLIKQNKDKLSAINDRVTEINKDETYTPTIRDTDSDIINSSLKSKDYQQAVYDREHLDNLISLQRKKIALWNKPEYLKSIAKQSINNAKTVEQLKDNVAPTANKVEPEIEQAIVEKAAKIEANNASDTIVQPGLGNSDLFAEDEQHIDNIAGAQDGIPKGNLVVDKTGNIEETTPLKNNDVEFENKKAEIEKRRQQDLKQNRDNISEENRASFDRLTNSKYNAELTNLEKEKPNIAEEDLPVDNTDNASFEPRTYDFDNSPQEAKDKIKNGVKGLLSKLPPNASFEDLVRHVVRVKGPEVADGIFNSIRHGWEANGRTPVDYDAVYQNVFGNPLDELIAGDSQLILSTPKEVEKAIIQNTNDIIAKDGEPTGFDNNNQPVYVYKSRDGGRGYVTNESSPKFAFVTIASKLIKEDKGDTIEVHHEYTDEELNQSDYVDSTPLLDPDKFNEGTSIILKIPSNFNDIKIPIFNPDGTKGTTMTFGQYVALNNLDSSSQEYRDKIPVIIYRKGASNNEKGLAFVHDIGWYHPLRFNQLHPTDMAEAIASTRAIREEVLNNNGKPVESEITGKRQTTFSGLKIKTPITLREANPETELTIANSGENPSVRTSKSGITYPNNNAKLINQKPFQYNGQVIEVRRYGMDSEGVPTYIGSPVNRDKLGPEAITSIIQAITIYSNRNNLTPEQKKVVEHIKSTMGTDMDITASPSGAVASGLKAYLSHFMRIYDPKIADKSTGKSIADAAKVDLAFGTPYLSFIDGGNIVFGVSGVPAFVNSDKQPIDNWFINPNSTKPSLALNKLNESINVTTPEGTKKIPRLQWYEHNLSLDALAANKPVVTIDKNYTSTVAAPTYNDYLLDHLTTNIKSINIGTEEKPNWVTNIQPLITYDTKSRLEKTEKQPSNQEVSKEVTPETETPEVVSNEKSQEQQLKEAQEYLSKILGKDKGISNSRLLEPALLEDEQVAYIDQSIERIAGLTPVQESTVTNFIFNQITGLVNLDTKLANKEDVDKQVEKAFDDVLIPVREETVKALKFAEDLIEKFPTFKESNIVDDIRDLKYKIATIDSIKNQFDTLKNIAYEKVKKNTGITENKQVVNREEGDANFDNNDEDTTRGTDFWTDILTESPENKLSYAMRRFFGQTKIYNKNNEAQNGFLNLPLYEDASNITRNLMTTLVDVPADFDSMLAKLEEKKDAVPWMKDVIERLKNASQQRKNQFVTVMHNTSLRMKFSLISYDRNRKAWSIKLRDSTLNGISATLKDNWKNNLLGDSDFNLVINDEEGNQKLNDKKAETLLHRFEGWVGVSLNELKASHTPIAPALSQVRVGKSVSVDLRGDRTGLLQELKTNLVNTTSRLKFKDKGTTYQISSLGGDKYSLSFLSKASYKNNAELSDWLREFGIIVSPEAMNELMTKGLFHNYAQRKPSELFETGGSNGLFGILYNSLKSLVAKGGSFDLTEFGNNPLDNSVVTSLANLEAKYSDIQAIFGFRVAGKSYFALTAPSFISDRTRDLKSESSSIRENLKQISFSSNSFWLTLLQDKDFRNNFEVVDDSAESIKQAGKKSYRAANLASLSDMDHELSKVTKFQPRLGEVRYGEKQLNKYLDTGIPLRLGTIFGLTMADKDRMKLITTALLDLGDTHLKNGIHDEVLKALYNETVKPEILRMIKHAQNGGITNIAAYDKGASLFLMMPELNNVMINPNLKLVDAIKNEPFKFNRDYIENNPDIMADIKKVLKDTVEELVNDKLNVWDKNGYTNKKVNETDGTLSIDEIKFFDKTYMSKFSGTNEEKLKMAAMDYEINSLIANANNFMLFAGDPAMYYKSDSMDYVQQAKDTFTNINKRLANQVAPGTSVPGSEKEKYLQIFMNDRISTASNITYLEKLLGKEGASAYRKIKGSDAQEYTTWKEHLDILSRLGKNADYMFDITPEEINEVRDMISKGTPKSKLTEQQYQTLTKIMQPIKPVYTGQIYDKDQDVMRTVYIKSSSFPLIPQLTKGLEIDKLRQRMEQLQNNTKLNVRASYQTANKVGALNVDKNVKLWNDETGNINDDVLKDLSKYSLQLERKNFRIQQEVPFKSDRNKGDYITLGTQLMKLLFGDNMMNENGFNYNDKEYNGKELHKLFSDSFHNLIKEKQSQLFNELGLDNKGISTNVEATMGKLQDLLMNEAKKRGYPLQDIKGLEIDKTTGNFTLPLWASSNSNRYESMLNAIISNRMVAMKFPGSSSVTGSEEGFRVKKEGEITSKEKSNIIYTSVWNGESLQPNQVFAASKFRGKGGNLLDLLQNKDGKYVYVNKGEKGFTLNEDMFDKELLSNISFRIPTSGHQSGSRIEIAGFLPSNNGDLMIVGKNTVVQKGLDFDVDKENAYHLWTHITDNGKIEVLQEKHRNELLKEAEDLKADKKIQELQQRYKDAVGTRAKAKIKEEINSEIASRHLFDDIGGDYADEDIAGLGLQRVNSKINEKLFQNEIVKINNSVYANQKESVQSKITRVLSTDFAVDQANKIEALINQSKQQKKFTALSSEFQKQSMIGAASSVIGRGAYSLDVTFHSLVQQANIDGKPLELNVTEYQNEAERTFTDDRLDYIKPTNKQWRFGNIESTGVLGNTNTIEGSRSIAEVVSERQNMAVDNASLGNVLGKLNLNDLTFDVDKVFNLLGIDKGNDGNSIPFLFLSQPIIREYVDAMKNANSIFADYEQDKEQKIIDRLLSKYDPTTKDENIDEEYWNLMSDQMDNKNLINSLSTANPDGKLQGAVLRRFVEMRQYGLAIRGVQAAINLSNSRLGKSFFDIIDKRNALNRLGYDSIVKLDGQIIGSLSGGHNLIGDYINKEDVEEPSEDYIDIGNYYVKPTTITGAFSINAISTAYNLWSKYFPYDSNTTQAIFDEITPIISNADIFGGSKAIQTKQDIFQEIKKYLAANKMNGIIRNTDDVNAERKRLYIDSDTNTSLPKYMKELSRLENNPIVNDYIKTNKLINRFEYILSKDGKPSSIKYNNAQGEEFDEQYLYGALSSLLVARDAQGNRIELPKIGNKSYTLDSLAQDLIAYSYLGNSIQEAIQFTKYVPVSYLNTVGYSQWLKNSGNSLGIKLGTTGIPGNEHLVSEFTMQYIQHNPGSVKYRLDDKSYGNKITEANSASLSKLETFKLKSPEKPIFISIYNPTLGKGENKYQLYWYDGTQYTKIPVLGISARDINMDEYQPEVGGYGQSIVNGRVKVKANPQQAVNTIQADESLDTFDVNSGNLKNILVKISDAKMPALSDLANAIAPYVKETTKIAYANEVGGRGVYYRAKDEINIDRGEAAVLSAQDRARTILHETVHALTQNQISPYITQELDGSVQVGSNAPGYVVNLVRLYNEVRSKSDTKELQDILSKVQSGERISKEELNTKYGLTNIDEFIAMALTPGEFQKYLAKNEFKQSGQTLLDRFKEVIHNILSALGVKFDSNTAAAQAINSIFELIDEGSKTNIDDIYKKMADEAMNDDFDIPDLNEDEQNNIIFEEEQTSGYRNRTIKNASADATIAIAVDFSSAGEKLTKSSVEQQGKKYIPVNVNYELKPTKPYIDTIVNELNSVNTKSLNIAGNGIYTMKGKYTQDEVDKYTYDLLKAVLESPNLKNKITSIRTGGQTGFDEAGAKAARKLGISTTILAPKGWTFRNIEGRDISNEQQFKDRFGITDSSSFEPNFIENIFKDKSTVLFRSNTDHQLDLVKTKDNRYFYFSEMQSPVEITKDRFSKEIENIDGQIATTKEKDDFINSYLKISYIDTIQTFPTKDLNIEDEKCL